METSIRAGVRTLSPKLDASVTAETLLAQPPECYTILKKLMTLVHLGIFGDLGCHARQQLFR